MLLTDPDAMARAISICRMGIRDGQSPFGAAITKDGELVAEAHNTVLLDQDPTCHAEVNAIRLAAKVLSTYQLRGCVLYATSEPCPMCLAAIHWSAIDRVVFGASIDDAKAAGFRTLSIPAEMIVRIGGSPIKLEGGFALAACRSLFDEWMLAGHVLTY